jgi:phage gpG-like protein
MADVNVVFESHLGEFKDALETQIEQALIAIGMMAETYAKDGCPVDTGRLSNSITYDNDSRSVVIGTNVEYAKWVELGHHQKPGRYVPVLGKALVRDFIPGKPFLGPAAQNHSSEYRALVESALKS